MPCSRAWARSVLLVVACWLAPVAWAHAEPVTLDRLLHAFSQMPGLEAEFVEEKHIGLLAQPLVSRGTLQFTHPGLLRRATTEPTPSTVVVTPRALRLVDASGSQRIDLRSRPELQPFVESLVWILSGDKRALERAYALSFEAKQPDGEGWRLSLEPRREPLTQLLTRITIRGRGLAVHEVKVEESNGDYSVMRISSADPARVFSAAEKARLFRVDEDDPER